MQELLWTLISLADDDALCKQAIVASGALPCIVPLLNALPFDATVNDFMGVPALAARALRVLAEDTDNSGQDQALPDVDSNTGGSTSWQQDAVPRLLEMLSKPLAAELQSERVLRTTSSLNQRLRELRRRSSSCTHCSTSGFCPMAFCLLYALAVVS